MNTNIIYEKKQELETIRKHKQMGNLVRSRAKWLSEGEKPTSYFLNLENRHYVNKTISKLTKQDNNKHVEINKQEAILKEVETFYKNLYNSNTNADIAEFDLSRTTFTDVMKLNDSKREKLEGKITYEEALAILKNMSNNKSPESDGFTAEFFLNVLE